jgi:hypothetical protein
MTVCEHLPQGCGVACLLTGDKYSSAVAPGLLRFGRTHNRLTLFRIKSNPEPFEPTFEHQSRRNFFLIFHNAIIY